LKACFTGSLRQFDKQKAGCNHDERVREDEIFDLEAAKHSDRVDDQGGGNENPDLQGEPALASSISHDRSRDCQPLQEDGWTRRGLQEKCLPRKG